jgi:hypothetical protein
MVGGLPDNTVGMWLWLNKWEDTGVVDTKIIFHPYETNASSKRKAFANYSTAADTTGLVNIDLIDEKFCILLEASGANTSDVTLRLAGVLIAAP